MDKSNQKIAASESQTRSQRFIAQTPRPPYYAVIFTSVRTEGDNGYMEAARIALDTARQQPGFLGYESARTDVGISVSYWESLEAIKAWKHHPLHQAIQKRADDWYSESRIRICRVERDY